MINRNITEAVETYKLSGAVAAGTDGSFQALTEIDMKGWEGLRVIFVLGAIASSGVITTRLKNSATTAVYGAGTIDRIGSNLANSADTDDDKLIIHEVHRPKRRFVQVEYQRTGGNVTIEAVIVERYGSIHQPISQNSNVETYQVLSNPEPSAS